jgi:hypothetical protein
VEPPDLRPVHAALAAVCHQLRLRGTPPRHRRRPLPRPTHVADRLTRLDHRAVEDPGDDGRHLAGGDGDHRLVEQGDARRRLTELDEDLTPTEVSEGHHVGGTGAPPDPRRLGEGRRRRGGVSPGELSQAVRGQQQTALGAVIAGLVEQASRPRQPASAAGLLAVQQQADAEPDGAAGRTDRVSDGDVGVMGPGPGGGALLVLTGQVGGDGQALEVLADQRRDRIGGRHRHTGLGPCPSPEGRPGPVPCVSHTTSIPRRQRHGPAGGRRSTR